jgi:Cytochrome b5-like Heme/Steroid binding domain
VDTDSSIQAVGSKFSSHWRSVTIMKYFRRDEIVVHNTISDIWVIINGQVFDLSKLLKDRHDSDTVNEVSNTRNFLHFLIFSS